jgi:mRNA interferase RelE/StbE
MFTVEYSKQAYQALKIMPRNTARIIQRKISELAKHPHSPNKNIKKLQGQRECRLRIGDWRVIYDIHDDILVIEVIRIKPRGGAYT